MATNSNRFPLQNSIRKILDDPNSRPKLPSLDEGSVVGDDKFGEADHYDSGTWSDIAVNNGNVVLEVHESEDSLWYRLGQVDGKKITWGNDDRSTKYDSGVTPSAAMTNDGLVVEVHQSQGLKNALWYRLGQVEGNQINWRRDGKSIEYDNGQDPSVAINNNGLVVEIHKSANIVGTNDTLWYRLGQVKGDIIEWGNGDKSIEIKDDSGTTPSVGITDDGLVVEAHSRSGQLLYRLGQVEDNIINWHNSDKRHYANGSFPSVGITNDGLVVAVSSFSTVPLPTNPSPSSTVWYHRGQVKGDTIDWVNEGVEYGKGGLPRVACNGQLAVETHREGEDKLLCSVLTLPAFQGKWIALEGDNSYCYCACNSATDNKLRHASSHTMNVKAGAPYFYAVLTKDDDSIDFPTGAVLTIEGPDGTKYDRDIEDENQLVIMSSASVACLVVKDPQPGDWKMTMTVPEGVEFHCECNTVPSKDVYDTLDNALQKRGLGIDVEVGLFSGLAILASILVPEITVPVTIVRALYIAAATAAGHYVLSGKSGDTKMIELSKDEQIEAGTAAGKAIKEEQKKGGIRKAAHWAKSLAMTRSKKKKQVKRDVLLTWNLQGANWEGDIASSPWIKIREWFQQGNLDENNDFPYRIQVACLQECGSPPINAGRPYSTTTIGNGVTLEKYFWNVSTDRNPVYLYVLFYRWDVAGNRVNLAVVSPSGISYEQYLPGHLRPLIGIDQGGTYFYTIHGSSSGGVDSWALLRDIAERHNDPNTSWWVAGDYNIEPDDLRQRLDREEIDLTVCPPNENTHPSNAPRRKLDYSTRNARASEERGIVPGVGFGFSDHLAVFYLLN
jgi:hypothetical protein